MVQALFLSVQSDGGTLTTEHYERMRSDVAFSDAWRNTLLLLLLVVPLQITLALVMALLVHSRIKGHAWFLYVYAIPLAISDLAAGILWLAVFTESGYLNTILQGIGVIDRHLRQELTGLGTKPDVDQQFAGLDHRVAIGFVKLADQICPRIGKLNGNGQIAAPFCQIKPVVGDTLCPVFDQQICWRMLCSHFKTGRFAQMNGGAGSNG